MIIDEILDNKDKNGVVRIKDLDWEYIEEEAKLFGFDYLIIDKFFTIEESMQPRRYGLKRYMEENGYGHLLKDIEFK